MLLLNAPSDVTRYLYTYCPKCGRQMIKSYVLNHSYCMSCNTKYYGKYATKSERLSLIKTESLNNLHR